MILEEHNHCCIYCGRNDLPLEQEHKIPVSRGGGYTADNIVPACRPCNIHKGTQTYIEFLSNLKILRLEPLTKSEKCGIITIE